MVPREPSCGPELSNRCSTIAFGKGIGASLRIKGLLSSRGGEGDPSLSFAWRQPAVTICSVQFVSIRGILNGEPNRHLANSAAGRVK